MDRLPLELARLHFTDAHPDDGAAHALVLELRLPAGWERLSQAWQGVQSELDLPAPAIAVSGGDGVQLWFPLAAPVARDAGAAFLDGLRARWLQDVDPSRVRLLAGAAALPPVPPVEIGEERWSAFVSPDLASVFADTPWLDIPPTDEGQAALLRAIEPIAPAAFEAAQQRLVPVEALAAASSSGPPAAPASDVLRSDPARFLARVMDDETAPLALRIEAAKALLPYAKRAG